MELLRWRWNFFSLRILREDFFSRRLMIFFKLCYFFCSFFSTHTKRNKKLERCAHNELCEQDWESKKKMCLKFFFLLSYQNNFIIIYFFCFPFMSGFLDFVLVFLFSFRFFFFLISCIEIITQFHSEPIWSGPIPIQSDPMRYYYMLKREKQSYK